ncbi:MAG TPA: HAMP domain-containing sensor histidine kinase [Candidatus Thermoplasmatota archaeon]|nr:HAMP domain-containing sensor histidine kinase [Candidatus Thermoplasmatota archaeon]
MKTYLSLSLKLTLIVVAVSASVIFSLTLYNINDQSISFENIYVDKAKDTAAALEIFRNETITNTSFPAAINSIQEQNNDSIEYIHFFEKKQDNIILAHSTNSSEYDGNHDEYVLLSMNESKIVKITSSNTKKITVIAPGFSSTNQSFAYEFSYLTTDAYQILQQRSTNLFLISGASLFILIFSVLFLLRHTIVKPIIQFRDAAKIFGKGNLQTRIPLSSNDELGELADAFNTMAEDLEKSRETLEEYNKILERLIDQKDAFIGQLGHDLKNPLQPLIGLLPILIQQEKDPKMKEHLKVMNENAQYMKELIFKTLELAKLRTEKISFEFDKLPLSETVDRVITTQKPMLEKNNISISNLIPKNIFMYADTLRLQEVFKNLITNAVKYTPDNGGKISISAKEKKDYVQVSITDTGIGMSKEQIKKIFDEFYRADSSTHGQDSVGLGLSITKRIIEKHNGKIWAESNGKDKGSTFHFTLPKKGEKNQ